MNHAFEALSLPISECPNTDTKRHFNLDIAKLMFVLSHLWANFSHRS